MGAEGAAPGRVEGALRRLAGRRSGTVQVAHRVATVAGADPHLAVLEERLRGLERQVGEVRSRVNGLLFMVLGAVVAQLVLRLLG